MSSAIKELETKVTAARVAAKKLAHLSSEVKNKALLAIAENLALRRNEIDATIGNRGTYAEFGYLRLNRNIDPSIEDLRDREEIRVGGRVQFARYWSIFGSAI